MPLPETLRSGVYNGVLMTIEERPGATLEMFKKFLRDHSVPNTEIEAVREPYASKPGYHYHSFCALSVVVDGGARRTARSSVSLTGALLRSLATALHWSRGCGNTFGRA